MEERLKKRRNLLLWLLAILPLLPLALCAGLLRGCTNQHSRAHGHQEISFDISPAGDMLVFNAAGTGEFDLYLFRLDKFGLSRIAGTAEYETAPSFTPDGETVAYSTPSGVYAVPVDKSSPPRLLADLNSPHEVVSSNDRKILAYTRGQFSGSLELLLANADGSAECRLIAKGGAYYRPRFTPNGDRVNFFKEEWPDGPTGHPRFSLWRVDVDGKNLQKIASSRLFDEPLKWRPEAD